MTAILVPVALDVLTVRPGDPAAVTADTALRDVPEPDPGTAVRFDPAPPPFGDRAPRPPGAYLHWALPDGLTAAQPAPDAPPGSDPSFPPIPDRWLIARLSGDAAAGRRRLKAWLLPHAAAGTAEPLVVLPTQPDPPAPAATTEPITALGPGDLSWSAYYDNVENRFAFHDDLADVTEPGPIAYLLAGWYTDPAGDPLAAATNPSDAVGVLVRLRWAIDLTPPGNVPVTFPLSTVCHAAAVASGWPEMHWSGDGGVLGAEAGGPPDPATVDVALGETVAEAIGALSAEPHDVADRLVEGLLAGALGELAAADGTAKVDAAAHAARFNAIPTARDEEWLWPPDPDAASLPEPSDTAHPRVYAPRDPAVVVRGAGRSGKHGADGRFDPEGWLHCRRDVQVVTAFGVDGGDPGFGARVLPDDALTAVIAKYAAPAICSALLVELASLDPGSVTDRALASPGQPSPLAAARARFWLTFDPAVDPAQALAGTSHRGTLPSPIGVTAPTRPWNPLQLEWTGEYLPCVHGAHDWTLEDLDFGLPQEPPLEAGIALRGRVALTPGPATVMQGAVHAVTQHVRTVASASRFGVPHGAAGTRAADLVAALADTARGAAGLRAEFAGQDLLGGELTGVAAQLRGDPPGVIVRRHGDTAPDPPAPEIPATFVALRSGALRLDRLRIVDTYGQTLTLRDASGTAGGTVAVGSSMAVPGRPDLASVRPRFTAPARIFYRYVDALAAPGRLPDAAEGRSPVCGFLLPSPVDASIEVFDAEGRNQGSIILDEGTGRAVWEESPGRPSVLGSLPSASIENPWLGRLCDGLIGADARRPDDEESALAALLRAIDTTRWTVDLTGRAGDEHLAMLVGSPVVVLRARLSLDVRETPAAEAAAKERAVPVKLGSLARTQDGLLAYAVEDDYSRVRIVDPAVSELAVALPAPDGGEPLAAGPIASAYIDASPTFDVHPNISVALTVLAVPLGDVHVTAGLLPQKGVGMVRQWVGRALARMSPAWRRGPVLRDPQQTRLPVATDLHGTWRWHRRVDPFTWETDPIVSATKTAVLPEVPAVVSEGWLQVRLAPDALFPGAELQIDSVTIPNRDTPRPGRITFIGSHGTNGDPSWKLATDVAVTAIESGRLGFFVEVDGHRVDVIVEVSDTGRKFLQTVGDVTTSNNLRSLPEIDF